MHGLVASPAPQPLKCPTRSKARKAAEERGLTNVSWKNPLEDGGALPTEPTYALVMTHDAGAAAAVAQGARHHPTASPPAQAFCPPPPPRAASARHGPPQ